MIYLLIVTKLVFRPFFEPFCARLDQVYRSLNFSFATKYGSHKFRKKVCMKNFLWKRFSAYTFLLFSYPERILDSKNEKIFSHLPQNTTWHLFASLGSEFSQIFVSSIIPNWQEKTRKTWNCEKSFFTKSGRKFPRVLEILSQWWLCSSPVRTTQVSILEEVVRDMFFLCRLNAFLPTSPLQSSCNGYTARKGYRFSRLQSPARMSLTPQSLPGRE